MRLRFELVEPEMVPEPMAPPGAPAVPTLPAPLPVYPSEGVELHRMLRGALTTELPRQDLETLAYLIRRAHGQGWGDGLRKGRSERR